MKDRACFALSGIEDPNGVGGAGDASCSGHAVEGIVCALLSDVVDGKKGKPTINRELLKLSYELVVIDELVGVSFPARENSSKGVDNDQMGLGCLSSQSTRHCIPPSCSGGKSVTR